MRKLKSLEKLEDSFCKLPSVGKKSAERLAYAILDMDDESFNEFISSLKDVKTKIHKCPKCGMITDSDECTICDNSDRDKSTLMIVSYPKDVLSLEKSEGYHGLYHVLNGEISMSKGIAPSDLKLESLFKKINEGDIKEVILATNPTLDGETTALYIAKNINSNITVTRLAYGLQMGGNIDYTDQLTLLKALQGRQKI